MKTDVDTVDGVMSPAKAMAKYGQDGMDHYHVNSRGRPPRSAEDAAEREIRLHRFGAYLRDLRESVGLSPRDVVEMTGISSPRKLTQYETNCYPPGEIVLMLSKCYGVPSHDLAIMALAHSDPEMHLALTGRPGISVSQEDIEYKLASKAGRKTSPQKGN
jgi:transcriptional regulator with XRE-family HTH domain